MNHISVMLNEAINRLEIKEDGIYLDATLGRAGHSSEILKRLETGKLFCIDRDKDALIESKSRLEMIGTNFKLIHSNFKDISKHLEKTKFDGILFDLGISSPQVDDQARGFSYNLNAKLDMRMDQSQSLSAWDVVNTYPQQKLIEIFKQYGEDKSAKVVARGIIKAREIKSIDTTFELVEIIKKVKPEFLKKKKHPAKQIFQAIRIEVNNELFSLRLALNDAINHLKKEGRLIVITFNSLEDKIVKDFFIELKEIKKETPFTIEHKWRTMKTLYPTDTEVEENRRAKSAKLRTIIRKY